MGSAYEITLKFEGEVTYKMKLYGKSLEFAKRVLWLIKCLEEGRTTPERFISEIRKLALQLKREE